MYWNSGASDIDENDLVYEYDDSDIDYGEHILETKLKKVVIQGYTGFRPQRKYIVSARAIPTVKEQLDSINPGYAHEIRNSPPFSSQTDYSNYRKIGRNMDTRERYEKAIELLYNERSQTPEQLIKIVQAKLSSRVSSYAQQLISLRKVFEAFDVDMDERLDENEFRECMERMNVQFDDVQCLALYAYFDVECTGLIDWHNFSKHTAVHNPKGGTAVLPKAITDTGFDR